MTRKVFKLIAIIIITGLILVFGYVFGKDDIIFFGHKREVLDYVEDNYSKEFQLCYSKAGESRFMAERNADLFIFHDKEQDIYFDIEYGRDGIEDYYNTSYYGKKIRDDIVSFSEQIEIQTMMIRCWNPNDSDDFTSASGQMILFTDSIEQDKESFYQLVQYVIQTYTGIDLSFVITALEHQPEYEALFRYEKIEALCDLPHEAFCVIDSEDVSFQDLADFTNFIQSENGRNQ